MIPAPGEHLLRFVGDRLQVTLEKPKDTGPGARAFLRTNLTRETVSRREVIAAAGVRPEDALTFAGASWRDIPLEEREDAWSIDLPLLEVGHFRAKAYWVDAAHRQHWPEGSDLGISVHPDHLRTQNLIYCAFPRAMGRTDARATPRLLHSAVQDLDERGFTVIPPSGTLRDLTRALPHIFDTLGCRILHLLPVGPVPTTYARMGRYGSPYAQLDLTAIDPALVEFDRRTTGVDQFRELTDSVHLRGGLVILDVVLNHTGWESRLLTEHPEWFKRDPDGAFHSPGAWGNTWADLVELDQRHAALWEVLASALLEWCRRGVDGFRCDAGYMIPLAAWQYIVARVRDSHPDCLFLLEGLGGPWEATEALLTQGGMQWAYSELFQCYEPTHVAHYLDHAIRQGERIGVLAHYSETHDNDRLAKRGATWARMRNSLSALASQCGAFGFTSGVEWLCTEKIDVHEAHSLGWDNAPNLLSELSRLNALLGEHPCFFDGARIERVSEDASPVLALHRTSADGRDHCLVLINLDVEAAREITLPSQVWTRGGEKLRDLLGQTPPAPEWCADGSVRLALAPGQAVCLAPQLEPLGMKGREYRLRRAQAAWAYTQLGRVLPHEALGAADFAALGAFAAEDPERFLSAALLLKPQDTRRDLLGALMRARDALQYPRVVEFVPRDVRRVTLVPPGHWVLVRDERPFEVEVRDGDRVIHARSVEVDREHVVALAPHAGERERDVRLQLSRFTEAGRLVVGTLRFLAAEPVYEGSRQGLVLLTNGRGAMARMSADLGAVKSKYDCALGANLHPEVPCDRHIFIKRVRAWVNADGFITALDRQNLVALDAGPPACFTYFANAGDGRRVGIRLTAGLVREQNALVLRLERVPARGTDLPPDRGVRVILRVDLEDRNMHTETVLTPELEAAFTGATSTLKARVGFAFAPAPDRHLRVWADLGAYHEAVEWMRGIHHSVDENRGLPAYGDCFSPGWFELPVVDGHPVTLIATADSEEPTPAQVEETLACTPADQAAPRALSASTHENGSGAQATHGADGRAGAQGGAFELQLRRAAEAFVVRRGRGKTVIAGYPWFLDWGRDTLICARGLAAAGFHQEVLDILLTFAAMERGGTLPNHLAGAGEGSRETSDAPLWFGLACEELAREMGASVYEARAEDGRTLREVLRSIAEGYLRGTEHGVGVDPESGLVFSPPHFTWMDTNYPAGTPREGYPIELSVLFARLLRQLGALDEAREAHWLSLAARTEASLARFYRPELGYCSDTLHAAAGTPASEARPDDHLRPNQLLAVSLGAVSGERARSIVCAAERHLLVPGGLRSLAPLPVSYGLPIRGASGQLLNDGSNPYWPRYEGDEDTRRKPAYHNGTVWCWWLPIYCEALVAAYPSEPAAIAAARAVLGSSARVLAEGCIGQLPENLDGDAPHTQRGCDAQAWSVTEALRVWLRLSR